MKLILKIISFIGLGFTIIPAILVFSSVIDMKTNFTLMTIGMFIYFVTAPFWMESKSLES